MCFRVEKLGQMDHDIMQVGFPVCDKVYAMLIHVVILSWTLVYIVIRSSTF